MRRFVSACALVCALFVSTMAGPPDSGGSPEPPTCPPGETCAQSAAQPFVVILVNGVPVIVWLP